MKLKDLISLNPSRIMSECQSEVQGTLKFKTNKLLIEFISIIYRHNTIFKIVNQTNLKTTKSVDNFLVHHAQMIGSQMNVVILGW